MTHSTTHSLYIRWLASVLEFVPVLVLLGGGVVKDNPVVNLLAIALVVAPDLGWLLLRRPIPAVVGTLVRVVALLALVGGAIETTDTNVACGTNCASVESNFYYLAGIVAYVGWSVVSAAVILVAVLRLRPRGHRLGRADGA